METSLETLKAAAFEKLTECRKSIHDGRANLSGLDQYVKEYCMAIVSLGKEEGRAHGQDLQALMQEVQALEAELTEARNAVREELAGLGRMQQANVAYQRSDHMGPVKRRRQEEDE